MDETKTTGTPDPSEGDLHDAESPAPDDGDRDAESREPDYKRMYLDAKSKVELANRLEAENAELKSRLEQSPAAASDEPDVDDEDVDWKQVQAFAAKGDPVAKAQIRERTARIASERNAMHLYQLQQIDDRSEREEVREHFRKNRHRLGDIDAAASEVRLKKREAENAKLREELKRATVKNDPDVVRTSDREVTASQVKAKTMTNAEWEDEQKSFLRSGDIMARMRRQEDLAAGKIVLKG